MPSNLVVVERFSRRRRHISMRTWWVVLALIATIAAAPSAAAQQSVEVEASVGLDGFVDPDEPTRLTVTVRSPSLFVGSVDVSMRNFQTSVPIEVPSDGLKEVVLDLPAPGSSTSVAVRLVDGDGDPVLDRDVRVPLDPGFDQILTGVLGSSRLLPTLEQVRSEPLLLSVTPVSLDQATFDERLSALDYIVAGSGSLRSMDADGRAVLAEWVEQGGRLISSANDADALGLAMVPAGSFGVAEMAMAGRGEVLVVADPAAVQLGEWPRLLRDVPQSVAGVNGVEFQDQSEWNLISAASAGGGAALPQIPWLAFALVGYAVVVGPVNFFVLKRMGRQELAWLTIPLLSLVTVGAFWLNGPRGDKAAISHASVLLFDAELPRAESGLVMVTGGEGTHELLTPAGWSARPTATVGPSNVVGTATTPDGSSVEFDLQSLEAATVLGAWTPIGAPLAASVEPDGNGFRVSITNNSDWTFWAWGVASGFDVAGRSADLEPAESAETTLRLTGTGDPWEPPMARVALQGNFDISSRDPWEVVYPLSNHLGSAFRDDLGGIYLFGFTDDIGIDFEVDGDPVEGTGTSLVVVPLDAAILDQGSVVTGELVYADGAQWVEPSGFSMFIGGANAVYLRFLAPDGVTSGTIEEGFNNGFNNEFAIYDWDAGEFVELDALDTFSGPSLLTPGGEMLVRLMPGEEFADVIPGTIRVEWDT